jgi:hypothetical protein
MKLKLFYVRRGTFLHEGGLLVAARDEVEALGVAMAYNLDDFWGQPQDLGREIGGTPGVVLDEPE